MRRLGGDITWGGNSSNFWAGTMQDVAIYSSDLIRARRTAEVIAEAPSGSGGVLPLANFVLIYFSWAMAAESSPGPIAR